MSKVGVTGWSGVHLICYLGSSSIRDIAGSSASWVQFKLLPLKGGPKEMKKKVVEAKGPREIHQAKFGDGEVR